MSALTYKVAENQVRFDEKGKFLGILNFYGTNTMMCAPHFKPSLVREGGFR